MRLFTNHHNFNFPHLKEIYKIVTIEQLAKQLYTCFNHTTLTALTIKTIDCRLIREEGYTGLIIGLTGDTNREDVAHFKAHGADAVLPKPFVLADFDRVVLDFMGQRLMPREVRLEQAHWVSTSLTALSSAQSGLVPVGFRSQKPTGSQSP